MLFPLFVAAACSSPGAAVKGEPVLRQASAAPSAELPAIANVALKSREAQRLAASLADDVGPRLAGSPGDAAAIEWAEQTMRGLGLANVHAEPVVVPVWRRGDDRAWIVGARNKALDVNALGWSGSTSADGVEGEVVRVATVEELEKLPEGALRGKIAFIDAPMQRTNDGSGYGRAVSTRYKGQTTAGAKGAVATLIRSVGTDDHNPHTGSTNRGDAPGIPIGALSNPSADLLAGAIASGPVRLHLVMTSQRLPDAHSANVVGEIVGSKKPEEVVLLAAHLDSWDTGRGALDDGAGCGAVLDAMRLLAAHKPARTVRVVLFAAEENSGAGGKEYIKAHASELERIVLSLEVDTGTDRVQALGFVGDPEKAPALRAMVEPLAPLGVRFDDGKAYAGADVSPLVSRGVPSVDVRQDASRYFDFHHTRGDTSDKIDGPALAQVTAVISHLALSAADPAVSFGRVPSSQRSD